MSNDANWTPERLSRASYKELGSPQQYEERFTTHLLSPSCKKKLRGLLAAQSTTTRDFSLEIDAFDLLQSDPVLGHFLLAFPTTLLQMLERGCVSAQRQLLKEERDNDESSCTGWTVKGDHVDGKSRVHARLVHLPPICCKLSLGSLQASDVGKIIQCSGTVVRTTPVCMYESSRYFRCSGKQGCGKKFLVQADLEQRANLLEQPRFCSAGGQEACKGRNFQPIAEGSLHTDYQEVTIQEAASQLGGANVPRSLLIKLQHDLVDRCQPGDEVIVVGMLISQWHQALFADVDCPVGMAVHAHSIRVVQNKSSSAWSNAGTGSGDGSSAVADLDDDKFRQEFTEFWGSRDLDNSIAHRDFIVQAVCPKLYGLAAIKLALLLTLIGGVTDSKLDNTKRDSGYRGDSEPGTNSTRGAHFEESQAPEPFQIIAHPETATRAKSRYGNEPPHNNGFSGYTRSESVKTRRRGQSHLLLVGDPGTGKSQFLRFAAAICPRSVLTTGIGTTSAGLTCAAVREGNGKEFSLEAGALVLADQGVCCIDEFGCIRQQDRTTIHEAMEQQTLSVAKAGIVCKLNCRATIVAVMNPRDCVYDNNASLSRNTGLGTPLLSRFDLIFKLVDSSDSERDSNVTTYLLNRAIQQISCLESSTTRKDSRFDTTWTMEKLRSYISFVREKFQPVMSDDAAILLEQHYEKNRASQSTTMPVTVRFLESLIRLSQAHARLMFREEVKLEDAVAVIRIMECSAMAYGGFDGNDDIENSLYADPMTIDFSDQPDLDFWCFEFRILNRYRMGGKMSAKKLSAIRKAMGISDGGESTAWDNFENARDLQHDRKKQRKH